MCSCVQILCAQILIFYSTSNDFIKRKEALWLLLPAVALALWAFGLGRSAPPFPLDEAHIKESITSQITRQLAGRSWKQHAGDRIRFQSVTVDSSLIRPEVGRIHIRCRIYGLMEFPREQGPLRWLIGSHFSLMSTEFGSPHRGSINIPGHGKVYLSIPGRKNDPRQTLTTMRRIQHGLCYHCGRQMSFFERLTGKQRHDKCQNLYESLYK